MYIYTPLCRYWITLYRYVLVFIVPHVDIELEDNKQFISNNPRSLYNFGIHLWTVFYPEPCYKEVVMYQYDAHFSHKINKNVS